MRIAALFSSNPVVDDQHSTLINATRNSAPALHADLGSVHNLHQVLPAASLVAPRNTTFEELRRCQTTDQPTTHISSYWLGGSDPDDEHSTSVDATFRPQLGKQCSIEEPLSVSIPENTPLAIKPEDGYTLSFVDQAMHSHLREAGIYQPSTSENSDNSDLPGKAQLQLNHSESGHDSYLNPQESGGFSSASGSFLRLLDEGIHIHNSPDTKPENTSAPLIVPDIHSDDHWGGRIHLGASKPEENTGSYSYPHLQEGLPLQLASGSALVQPEIEGMAVVDKVHHPLPAAPSSLPPLISFMFRCLEDPANTSVQWRDRSRGIFELVDQCKFYEEWNRYVVLTEKATSIGSATEMINYDGFTQRLGPYMRGANQLITKYDESDNFLPQFFYRFVKSAFLLGEQTFTRYMSAPGNMPACSQAVSVNSSENQSSMVLPWWSGWHEPKAYPSFSGSSAPQQPLRQSSVMVPLVITSPVSPHKPLMSPPIAAY